MSNCSSDRKEKDSENNTNTKYIIAYSLDRSDLRRLIEEYEKRISKPTNPYTNPYYYK